MILIIVFIYIYKERLDAEDLKYTIICPAQDQRFRILQNSPFLKKYILIHLHYINKWH